MSIAQFADIALTISRPPGKRNVRTRDRRRQSTAMHTVPTGFCSRAAARPGDAGDGDADVDAGALANAGGHRERDRLAHRAVLRDQRLRHVEQLDLRAIAVRDDAAFDVLGAAGNVRDARRRQAAGARLGQRHPPAARAQQIADHGFEDACRRCSPGRRRAPASAPPPRVQRAPSPPRRRRDCVTRCSSTWPRPARIVVSIGG